MIYSLLIPALPLLVIAALAMLAPAPLAPRERRGGLITLLAIVLLALVSSLLMIRLQAGSDTLNVSRIGATSVVMLAGGLIAAPLLDRARTGGLVLGSTLIGLFMVPGLFHGALPKMPAISGVALLLTVLIASSLIGLIGSWQLPRSALRFTANGARRAVPVNTARAAGGWAVFALTITVLGASMLAPGVAFAPVPLLISGIVASFLQLMVSKPEDALQKAGEGLAAGVLIATMGPYAVEHGFLLGLVAGGVVMRSEAITARLKLDDAQHLTGAVLLPCVLGLLAPVVSHTSDMHASLSWLAVAVGLGVMLPLILWPIVKLTVGLARA